jgi:hypothetical protein
MRRAEKKDGLLVVGGEALELGADGFVVGDCFGHECPEVGRMVEFFEVAEFVHDDVVGDVRRKK